MALGWGLWESRNLPFVSDIGTLLAHRDVGGYTLSMSHFFDLTGPSFAALRLPAIIAAIALLIGPALGWILRVRRKHLAATVSIALTSAVFLIAAHIAFARFEPMLSSKQLADTIVSKGSPSDSFIIYGDQSDASSVVFYTHNFLHKPAYIVMEPCSPHGNGSSLLWGSCYPDAPKIFLSDDQLSKMWGTGERKWLFAQDTNQPKAEQLLAGRLSRAVHRRQSAVDGSAAGIGITSGENHDGRAAHGCRKSRSAQTAPSSPCMHPLPDRRRISSLG